MTTVDPRADLSALNGPDGSGLKFVVGQYVSLMKPRIIELLLITTIPVMFLAEQGVPDLWLVIATVVGGTLSAGARLMAVPGWPLPTFCTASAARMRAVSTARWSSSVLSLIHI